MRPFARRTLITGAGIVVAPSLTWAGGQTPAPRPAAAPQARPAAGASQMPRPPEGKPGLSGIWQALNTAAWDIQDHSSALAGYLGVPPGKGLGEGNEIPYKPAALGQKKK